jgi:hypothetical protein
MYVQVGIMTWRLGSVVMAVRLSRINEMIGNGK